MTASPLEMLLWMLGFIPDFIWITFFIAGIVGIILGFFIRFIPFVSTYRIPIQIISVILLLAGTFFQGVMLNEKIYADEKQRLEEAKAKAEAEAKQATADLVSTQGKLREEIDKKGKEVVKKVNVYLKGDPVTVEKEVTKDMSEAERAEWKRKFDELQKTQKECKFPELMVEELNNLSTRPKKEEKK